MLWVSHYIKVARLIKVTPFNGSDNVCSRDVVVVGGTIVPTEVAAQSPAKGKKLLHMVKTSRVWLGEAALIARQRKWANKSICTIFKHNYT